MRKISFSGEIMKNKRKKLSVILLLMLVTAAFTGCQPEKGNMVIPEPEQTTAEEAAETTQTETETLTGILSSTLASTAAPTTSKPAETTAKPTETTAKPTEKPTAAPEKTTVKQPASTTRKAAETTVKATEPTTKKEKPTLPIPDKNKNFFDDAVFIGDSISLGLKNYVNAQRKKGAECLGNAQFLVAGSMGYGNTLPAIGTNNSVHPKYQGKEVTVENGVKLIGAKKAFIMLGLNDFCIYSADANAKNTKTLIKRIVDANPGIKIYVQSVTPVIKARERGKFTNQNIDAYNDMLKKVCSENGWTYVDIASKLKNSNNCFRDDYCSDPEDQGVHMNYAGSAVWVGILTDKYS